MRFESDGYLTEKAGSTTKEPSSAQGTKADLDSATASLASGGSLNIAETQSVVEEKLVISRQGSEIDQQAVLDIKTRAANKSLDIESLLPRFWMSQTTNLIAAYHEGGEFNDIKTLDVRGEIEQWQERHKTDLRKLNTIVGRIVGTVKDRDGKKGRIQRNASGKLEIREIVDEGFFVLPDDLIAKFKWERDDGEKEIRSDHSQDAEAYLGSSSLDD